MEHWEAHYQDGQHDLDCIVENLYGDEGAVQPLRMCVDGTAFWGTGLDDWELSETEDEACIGSMMGRFSLIKYGSKDNGYHYRLQSYRLQVKIPASVISAAGQHEIPGELDITYSNETGKHTGVIYRLDGEQVRPADTVCQRFALVTAGRCFEASPPSEFFETSLLSICRQMAGTYYLRSCFGCLYSDYSPYGQGNLGNLCCFVKHKDNYLKVYSKYQGEYTIWDAFEDGFVQCQETAVCEQFAPRIHCLGGYRGNIYGE